MDDIRFAHYRILDINSNRILSNGGVTLAVAITPQGKYRVAGAICHEVDHYCKRNGRTKSKGRLFCKHNYKLEEQNKSIIRKINWVDFDTKPNLDVLLALAEMLYSHRLKKFPNYTLVNSGIYFKETKKPGKIYI
jgi:hypothetical protein